MKTTDMPVEETSENGQFEMLLFGALNPTYLV